MPTAETLLIFRIAGIACAVPAESVGSIVMPPAHLTQPPGSGRSTPGIFHHADFTYSVIDLHARFGIDTPRRGSGRLLLQDEGIRHFAFLVDEVVGLVRSEEGKWAALPPYLPHSVFWSGFLYRKEIVLCSELGALRTMHDAAPLRRHIEAMQQQAAAQQGNDAPAETATTETAVPAEQKPAKHLAESPTRGQNHPASNRPPPSPRSKDAPPKSEPPKMPAERGKAGPAKSTAADRRPARETGSGATTPPKPRVEPATAKPKKAKVVKAPITSPHITEVTTTPPAPPEHSPVAPVENDSSLLPLLLILTVLILPLSYWLWPEPPRQNTVTPSFPPIVQTRPAPVEIAAPPAVDSDTPEETPAKETTETQSPPPAPPTTHREPPAPSPAAPLTIERDAEGTINLIIDRQAIATSVPLPELPPPETMKDNDKPAGESAPEAAAADATGTAPADAEDAPLQPDADWPAPATPTGLEPCDCTHTVVRGDTLWDIAEQYTGNAFNYHDLARRSGISNPDRIYPGDKVRIIIR